MQSLSRVGPLERLRKDDVEVLDECQEAVSQVIEGGEAGALEQPSHQDAEPDLHQEQCFGV